ncbi:hypothetical protein ACOSQ4_023666 [Xanthoceras sorbifolium]
MLIVIHSSSSISKNYSTHPFLQFTALSSPLLCNRFLDHLLSLFITGQFLFLYLCFHLLSAAIILEPIKNFKFVYFSLQPYRGGTTRRGFCFCFFGLMDVQLLKRGLEFSRKRKKLLLFLAAYGFSGYGLYRVYHSPFIAQKRKRVSKLLGALISVAEAVSDSAEAIGVVSKDLKVFLQSDSDQIPNSLKQISKITSSNEFSESVVNITRALTFGVLLGYRFRAKADGIENTNSGFMDKVADKFLTKAGSGFASVVVGSFARNLVMAFYSDEQFNQELFSNSTNSISKDRVGLENNSVPRWVDVVCSDKCRELIADCIQFFVRTAVAVYLDKTMDINTFDQFFAGLTDPKHDAKVREVLVAACNGAIETFVKTSHQVFTSSDSSSGSPYLAIDQGMDPNRSDVPRQEALYLSSTELKPRNSFEDGARHSGWVRKVSSTLSKPINRKFVLDVTGRATFEMVRSFLEVLLQKLYDGLNRSVHVVHETIVQSGLEVVKHVSAKSSAIATVCFSLCLSILDGVWIMAPA